MDISSAFKSEVFRPTVTVLVPGIVALGPYIAISLHDFPQLRRFWDAHEPTFVAVILLLVLAVGMVLENLGALVEGHLWDGMIQKRTKCQRSDWYKYLSLVLKDEPIGQRYLRTVTLKLKFELAMIFALPICALGLRWFEKRANVFGVSEFRMLAAVLLGLAVYCVFESYQSAKVLSKVRHQLVHGTMPEDLGI